MKKILTVLFTILSVNAYAATPVDLSKQNQVGPRVALLNPLLTQFKENRRELDSTNTLHIRVQQTYANYPVWGGDAVLHVKEVSKNKKISLEQLANANDNMTMNGTMYKDLQQDLEAAPENVFTKDQEAKAIEAAIDHYQQQIKMKSNASDQQSKSIVYVDKNNKAHWAYLIKFHATPAKNDEPPAIPTYILDAKTLHVYQYWNDMQTVFENVTGGGFGGNVKLGQLVYSELKMQRDPSTQMCHFQNSEIHIKECEGKFGFFGGCITQEFLLACPAADPAHNNVYWNADKDRVNDGYSPSNDALFNGHVVIKMYHEWFGTDIAYHFDPDDKTPALLTLVVHAAKYDGAYYDGLINEIFLGDGEIKYYPLTSLEVIAHEASHIFTAWHSGLEYRNQSGALNESFSDMAAKAAEFYFYGKNKSWTIGADITKAEGEAMRYMDQPSKDCKGKMPGNECSIDDATQYNDELNVHHSSGVYNRFFYTLSATDGWNTEKAFRLMERANAYYWTSTTNFAQAACAVLKAADDLGDDKNAIIKAFAVVKIDTHSC